MTDSLKARLDWWVRNESGLSRNHHVGAIRTLELLWPVIEEHIECANKVIRLPGGLGPITFESGALKELEAALEPERD